MPIYIVLALAAAFLFSLNAIILKLASNQAIRSAPNLIFFTHLTNLIFLPALANMTQIQFPWAAMLPLFLFSLTFFLGVLFVLHVIYAFDVSVLHPFFHFQTIFSVGLAYFFLGERYPLSVYGWIALIIIGGIIVSLNEQFQLKTILSKSFLLFLVGIFFYACSDIFVVKTLQFTDVYNLKFWSLIMFSIFSVFLLPFLNKAERISLKKLTPLLVANTCVFGGTIFLFTAFTYNVTISQPIAMFGSLFTLFITVILSRIKPELLEKHSTKVYMIRTLGVVLMLFSAIMILRS